MIRSVSAKEKHPFRGADRILKASTLSCFINQFENLFVRFIRYVGLLAVTADNFSLFRVSWVAADKRNLDKIKI